MPFVNPEYRCTATLVRVAVAALVFGCPSCSVSAQEPDGSAAGRWTNGPYLFGDWNGKRTRLENAGVVLNLIYVNDFLTETRGGLANWSRVRGTLDIDFGKAEL